MEQGMNTDGRWNRFDGGVTGEKRFVLRTSIRDEAGEGQQ